MADIFDIAIAKALASGGGGGGGGSAFVVKVAVTSNGDDTFTINTVNKTLAEIQSAYNSGLVVYAEVSIDGIEPVILQLTSVGSHIINFSRFDFVTSKGELEIYAYKLEITDHPGTTEFIYGYADILY